MLYFVFLFSIQAYAVDIPEVQIVFEKTYENTQQHCSARSLPKIYENSIYNVNIISYYKLYHIQCFAADYEKADKYINNLTNLIYDPDTARQSYIYPMYATLNDLSKSKWKCNFCTKPCNCEVSPSSVCVINYDHNMKDCCGQTCEFELHYILNISSISVNGETVETEIKKHNKDYDALGFYTFYEDEPTNIVCSKGKKIGETVILRLSSETQIDGLNVTTGSSWNSVELYIKLEANYDGRYVDCFATRHSSTYPFITRIYFNLTRDNDNASIGFTVNGVKFSKKLTKIDDSVSFTYEYYEGEKLNVILTGENYIDHIKCNKSLNGKPSIDIKWLQEISYFGEPMAIDCTANKKTYHDTRSPKPKIHFTLNIVPRTIRLKDFDPVISSGFPMSNVLVKFLKNQLTAFSIIHLTKTNLFSCTSLSDNVNFTSTEIDGNNIKDITDTVKSDNGAKTFAYNINYSNYYNMSSADFQCKNGKNITDSIHVIFPKNLKEIATGNTRTNGSLILYMSTSEPSSEPPEEDGEFNAATIFNKGSHMVIFAVCSVIVVVILFSVCILVTVRRNRKCRIINTTGNEYTSLYENREVSIPHQLSNEYATPTDLMTNDGNYSVPFNPKIEDMYAKPVPKHHRQDNNPTYAQVLPKSQRSEPPISTAHILKAHAKVTRTDLIENESPYAEVSACSYADVSNSSENPYAYVSNQSVNSYASVSNQTVKPYTQIMFPKTSKEFPRERPNLQNLPSNASDNKYCNDFEKQSRYVNAHSNEDYVEPEYCDMVGQ